MNSMKTPPKLLIFMALALQLSLGFSQTVELSLDQAWELYQSHSPALQRLLIDQGSALRDVNTPLKSWIPSVSASSGLSRTGTPGISTWTNKNNVPKSENSLWSLRGGLDFRLTLDPAAPLQSQKENLTLQMASLEVQIQKSALLAGLQKAYFQIQAQEQALKFLEESQAAAKLRYSQIQLQFDKGLRSDLELLSAQIAASRDIPTYQKAKADQEKRLLTLRQNLGFPLDQSLKLITAQTAMTPLPPLEEILKSVDRSPDVLRAQVRKELSKVSRDLGRSARLGPSLGASLGYSTGVTPVFDTSAWSLDTWTDSLSLGLSLSLPLDSNIPGSSGSLALLKLDEDLQKQDLTLEEARSKAENDLRSLVMDLEVSRGNRAASELNLSLQNQNYQKLQESFDKGKSSLQDLETARQDRQKALLSLETEKLNYEFLLIDLKVKMGE